MAIERKGPADVARRLGTRRDRESSRGGREAPRTEACTPGASPWRRETFVLSREEARATARKWFDRFPKAAYMTEIESWSDLGDGRIRFTMRRLPTAD